MRSRRVGRPDPYTSPVGAGFPALLPILCRLLLFPHYWGLGGFFFTLFKTLRQLTFFGCLVH